MPGGSAERCAVRAAASLLYSFNAVNIPYVTNVCNMTCMSLILEKIRELLIQVKCGSVNDDFILSRVDWLLESPNIFLPREPSPH